MVGSGVREMHLGLVFSVRERIGKGRLRCPCSHNLLVDLLDDGSGMLTLEACVSVTAFLILMLLMASLFPMFMAQNATAHAMLQTSQSLSVDAFAAAKVGTGGYGSVKDLVVKLTGVGGGDGTFSTNEKWYVSDDVQQDIEKRFIGYLAGGGRTEADALLKRVKVEDGIDGLDFSRSYVANNVLHIVLHYQFKNDFTIWNFKTVEVDQEVCSKLWEAPDI